MLTCLPCVLSSSADAAAGPASGCARGRCGRPSRLLRARIQDGHEAITSSPTATTPARGLRRLHAWMWQPIFLCGRMFLPLGPCRAPLEDSGRFKSSGPGRTRCCICGSSLLFLIAGNNSSVSHLSLFLHCLIVVNSPHRVYDFDCG